MHVFDRRAFLRLSGLVALAPGLELHPQAAADHTIWIRRAMVELAPRRLVYTSTYNGQFPGPLLRLAAGRPVVIDICNETEQVEWFRMHEQNLPLLADDDRGNGAQRIGAQACRRIAFTPTASGLHFYHSSRLGGPLLEAGVYSAQLGPVLIQPSQEPGRFDREVVLVLKEFMPRLHRGSRGFVVRYELFSINGRVLGHGEPVRVRAGERVLFHVLNGSATEIRRLGLPGHVFRVVALDGKPVPTPADVSTVRLGAGERVSAVVHMSQPGVWILGELSDHDRERGMGIVVEYAGCGGPPLWLQPPAQPWDYARFGAGVARSPDDLIEMTFATIEAARCGFNLWTINGTAFSLRAAAPLFKLRTGRRYRLKLHNVGAAAHCLHMPRHRFELALSHGTPTAGIVKDVVTIEAGQRLAMDFVPEKAGPALFYCRRQLHRDFGLVALFEAT